MFLFDKNILVLEGDLRQHYIYMELHRRGYKVRLVSNEINNSWPQVIIGAVPMKKIINLKRYEQLETFIAGCIPNQITKYCADNNIQCIDYMQDDELAKYNSIATAEGAIAEAIKSCNYNLNKAKSMVIGYGRCAETLADKLRNMGCDVSICVRSREAMQKARRRNYNTVDIRQLEQVISKYMYIFNTVPAVVINEKELRNIGKEACIIDIASKPGGIDYISAERLKVNAKLCIGLPGKYSPASSAMGIVECICK